MTRFRTSLAAAAALATALALAACSTPQSAPTQSGTPVSELRVALAEVTSNLDPATYNVPANYINISGAIGYLIGHPFKDFPYPEQYDGDIPVVDADTYEPELATEWSTSDDGLTVTLKLREGVKSAAGNELTAEDVVWTAQRNVALKSVGNFGMTVTNINKDDPATAIDKYTVAFNLLSPSPLIEKVLAWSWFAPIDSVDALANATEDDPWATAYLKEHTAFFGPYTVTEFTPGQSATMEANPNYWDDAPSITKITMQTVPDAGNRQQLVQRGEVDFVPDIPRSQLVPLEGNADLQVIYAPATRFSYLQYGQSSAPMQDEKVRQAISYAIPYDQIIADVYKDTALPAKTVGTWLPGADPDSSPYEFDIDKAQSLLDDSDYPDGFTVNLLYSMGNPGPENEQVAILIADSLKDIGITVNLQKPSSEAEFTTAYNAGQFEMALAGLSPGAPDTGYALFAMAYSTGYQNFGKFNDPEFDDLVISATSELDPDKRTADVAAALEAYEELMPATPIVDPLVGIVANPKFADLRLGSWGFPYWKYATLTE